MTGKSGSVSRLVLSGGVRKLFQAGPDPKTDFNANAYLRYRFGDIQ